MNFSLFSSTSYRAIGVLLNYFLFSFLTFALSKHEFAQYNLIFLWSNLFMIFGSLGLSEVLKFEYASGRRDKNILANVVFSFSFFSAFVFSFFSIVFIYFISLVINVPYIYFTIAALFIPSVFCELIFAYYIAINLPLAGVIFYHVQKNFIFIFSLIVFNYFHDLDSLLVVICQFFSISIVVCFNLVKIKLSVNIKNAKHYFNFNWKHGLNNVILIGVSTLILSIDSIMLSFYSPLEEVADYNFASRLVQIPSFLLLALSPSVWSYLIQKLPSNEYRIITNYIFSKITLSIVFFIIISTFIIFFWSFIFLFFDIKYSNSKNIFLILLIYKLFEVLFSWFGTSLNLVGLSYWILKVSLFPLFLNVILNFLLIPHFSGAGAAVASAISMSLYYTILGFKYFSHFHSR